MKKIVNKENLRWWILLTVIIGTFLGRLDGTIVNLALPKIINDFNSITLIIKIFINQSISDFTSNIFHYIGCQ